MDVNGIEQVEVSELDEYLARGVPLVDVREAGEWAEMHIPEAVLRPMSQVQQWQTEFEGKTILVQCRSGARSQQVAQYLAGRGITAHNLAGGIMAWAAKE